MGYPLNLTGQRFGKLIVLKALPSCKRQGYSLCRCDCGNEKSFINQNLKKGHTKSCGCLRSQAMSRRRHSHGQAGNYKTPTPRKPTKEYTAWLQMQQRCHNSKNKDYKNYGARGISVAAEWRNSFEAFFNHIGPSPAIKLSVDRIDNNSDYAPGNVRWATSLEQSRNRRNSKLVIER